MSNALWPWAEANQGFGGWIGSGLSVIAIFAAWGLARAEYRRDRRADADRIRAEAHLYGRIVSGFETTVAPFFQHAREHDGQGIWCFESEVSNSPGMAAARDLMNVHVVQWPSVFAWEKFQTFWIVTLDLIRKGSNNYQARITEAELDHRDRCRDDVLESLREVIRQGRRL